MVDLRTRPWRKLRVVVEVSVPPTSRATEKDLRYAVDQCLPDTLILPRPEHNDAKDAAVRLKCFSPFWPMFLMGERGINPKKVRKKNASGD